MIDDIKTALLLLAKHDIRVTEMSMGLVASLFLRIELSEQSLGDPRHTKSIYKTGIVFKNEAIRVIGSDKNCDLTLGRMEPMKVCPT